MSGRQWTPGLDVLETTILGRLVRGCHDDAVGRRGRRFAVPAQDGVGDTWCRRVAIATIDADIDVGSDEHLERRSERWFGEALRIATHEEWPHYPGPVSVAHDGGGRGDDVALVERVRQ